MIGAILSDGALASTNRGVNKSFRIRQSLEKSQYV